MSHEQIQIAIAINVAGGANVANSAMLHRHGNLPWLTRKASPSVSNVQLGVRLAGQHKYVGKSVAGEVGNCCPVHGSRRLGKQGIVGHFSSPLIPEHKIASRKDNL